MPQAQQDAFRDWIVTLKDALTEFHHGLCIGADEEAASIVREMAPACRIIGHPAFQLGHPMRSAFECDETLKERDPLIRNREIVRLTNILFASPKFPETKRSGSWSTIRFARMKKANVVILPD